MTISNQQKRILFMSSKIFYCGLFDFHRVTATILRKTSVYPNVLLKLFFIGAISRLTKPNLMNS